jgi:ABC-2 type transport system permease protein
MSASANVTTNAVRAGVRRGATEIARSLRAPEDITYYLVGAAILATVLVLNRNNPVHGTDLTVSIFVFPGALAFVIVFAAAFGLATQVVTEREDGTLLRVKAVPRGMLGYVVGQVTRVCLEVTLNLLLLCVPALLILGPVWSNGLVGLLHLLVLVLLGMLACVLLGFAVGSTFKNPRTVGGWGFLLMGGLVAISGLFAPLASLPGWLHPLAQVLPLYWLGLGMREAVLPDAAAAAELGEQWRTLEVFGVLGAWSVVGLLVAPVLLRRMARRESGSTVAARQQKALQRV